MLSANNAVVNTVDYKNTGIILHVQPRVNSNGSVLLNIEQEISERARPGTANNPNLTPTISDRKVSSEISVVSGQTVLLAGLIQDQQEKSRQGIPMLNQIPYVGTRVRHDGNIAGAHRTHHLHPAADHSGRSGCVDGRRRAPRRRCAAARCRRSPRPRSMSSQGRCSEFRAAAASGEARTRNAG